MSEKGVGSGRRKVEKRILVMKYNKNINLTYFGEYLLIKSV